MSFLRAHQLAPGTTEKSRERAGVEEREVGVGSDGNRRGMRSRWRRRGDSKTKRMGKRRLGQGRGYRDRNGEERETDEGFPDLKTGGGNGDQGGEDICRLKRRLTSDALPDANILHIKISLTPPFPIQIL